MSEPTHPIDKAYAQAEARASDEAARAARRARVLAAVAAAPAAPAVVEPLHKRRSAWPAYAGLMAAGIGGLIFMVANHTLQLNLRVDTAPMAAPDQAPKPPATASGPEAASTAPSVSASSPTPPKLVAKAPPARSPQPQPPPVLQPHDVPLPADIPAPAPIQIPPVASAPAFAPPPAAASEGVTVVGSIIRGVAPTGANVSVYTKEDLDRTGLSNMKEVLTQVPMFAASGANAGSASGSASSAGAPAASNVGNGVMLRNGLDAGGGASTLVMVDGKAAPGRAPPPPPRPALPPADLAVRLRAAAALGRTAEVEALLVQGASVDAADKDGNTALMAAIQSNRPATAALLLKHGASLDVRNQAGQGARDLAAAKNDPDMNRALGLTPAGAPSGR